MNLKERDESYFIKKILIMKNIKCVFFKISFREIFDIFSYIKVLICFLSIKEIKIFLIKTQVNIYKFIYISMLFNY